MTGQVCVIERKLRDGMLTWPLMRMLVGTAASADAVIAPTFELCMTNEMVVIPFGDTDRRWKTVGPRHSLSLTHSCTIGGRSSSGVRVEVLVITVYGSSIVVWKYTFVMVI